MPITNALYNVLQSQATLDQTRATTADTQALAQQRMLGVLLNQRALNQQIKAEELLKSGRFENPASTPGGAGPSPLAQYDYDSPLLQSAKSAQEGVNMNRQRLAIAKEIGDSTMWSKASADMDNQQKELGLAMKAVAADDARRTTQAAQAFQNVRTPEDIQAALEYVGESLGQKKAQAIGQQLARSLPGGIANATEEQIQTAIKPVTDMITARGNQLRFNASVMADATANKRIAEQARIADNKAAAAQAGVPTEELSQGGKEVLAEMTRKGLTLPGGSGRGAANLRITALNQMAKDMEKENQPYSSISQERMDYKTASATAQDFAKGPTARNITSINTSLGHLQTLGDLGKALNSGDVQAVNRVVNFVSNQFGNPELNNAQTAAQAVGEEMMRTFRVVGASVTEAAKWESKFNQALQSPEQMEGVIKTGADLLRSRLEAVDDQWRRGMKTDKGFPDIISPKNQEFLDSIGVKYNVNRSEAARARAEAAGAIPKPAAATAAGNDIQVGRGGLRYQYVGPPGGDRTKKENWKALQ